MRRVALLTSAFVLVMLATGCRHDGRTLRPAKADQTSSISTTALSTSTTTFVPDSGFGGNDSLPLDTGFTGNTDGEGPTVSAPWQDGGAIDSRYTCDGIDVSPALSWSAAPEGTVEIAITLTDLEAPTFVHWAIGGLGPQTVALDENTVPVGAYQALNGNGDAAYTGPCPPAGSTHTYVLTVHYLGKALQLTDGVNGADMVADIRTAELVSAQVNGTFSRP